MAFDIDGVIADTMNLFVRIARQDFQVDNLQYADITCYDLEKCLGHVDASVISAIVDKIVDGTYDIPLNPIAGAPEVLNRLCRRQQPVLLVTARPYPGPIAEWIKTHLSPDPDAIEMITTGDYGAKTDVLISRGIRCFVEDRLETCFALDAAGIEPVLFTQPWNRGLHPFREVASWNELESLMDL